MRYRAKVTANVWRTCTDGLLGNQYTTIRPEGVVSGSTLSKHPHILVLDHLDGFTRLDRNWFEAIREVENHDVVIPSLGGDQGPEPDAPALGSFMWEVLGDEFLDKFKRKSRTLAEDWVWEIQQAPSVFRWSPTMTSWGGDFRVNITSLDRDIRRLNEQDEQRIRTLYAPATALFNGKGFPQLQYLVMSGCKLQGLGVEVCPGRKWKGVPFLKFKTWLPTQNASALTYEKDPQYVMKFDLVTYRTVEDPISGKRVETFHINHRHGVIHWILTSKLGVGYIPLEFVKQIS